ncbi:hypothetical protein ACQKEM_15035 [Pseudomonas sp. NPDC077382]
MSETKTKIDKPPSLEAIENELKGWWRDLNLIVGPLALAIAIGCMSLRIWPGLFFSVLGCFVMTSIGAGIRPRRATRLAELRLMSKTDHKAMKSLRFAEENFLGYWKYFSFMAGFVSIGLVAAWHILGGLYEWLPGDFPGLVIFSK